MGGIDNLATITIKDNVGALIQNRFSRWILVGIAKVPQADFSLFDVVGYNYLRIREL